VLNETLRLKESLKEASGMHVKSHKNVKHKVGQYQCQRGDGCKVAFKTLKELDVHIKNMHTQEKEAPLFNCLKCDQSFDAKAKLRVHNEKKHTPHQTFQCENCDEVFTNQFALNNHLNEYIGFETV
jgi:Zn finger protein HypA/HybF involved in hydrogenase expression